MKRNVQNLLIIVSIIAGSVFMNACDEGYTINTKKMIQDEQDLLNEYLEIVEDTLSQLGAHFNYLDSMGYAFFELREGTGDSATVGKKVGLRYTYYQIGRDSTDTPGIYFSATNNDDPKPLVYTVGDIDVYSGIFSGLDLAVRHMTYNSKAWVFISSSLWTRQDFTPRVLELELTYLEN
jgi:hypothetical protein